MTNFFLYLTTVLVWGSTWLVINFQLGVVAPEVSVVYRHAIAALALFAWSWLRGLRLKFGIRAHLNFLLLGALLFGLNYIAAYSAQQYIPSALNAVVFSTMIWINLLNTRWFFGTRIELKVYLGATMGMLGILILFWPSVANLSVTDRTLVGGVIALSGAVFASLGNTVSHRAQRESLPIVQSNAWGMFYGAVLTAMVALVRGLPFNFEFTTEYIVSLLYLAIFGSIVAFGSYLKLLGRIGPHRAAYATVMFPVVAVILSGLFEGLAVEPHVVLGIALVLAGNLIILGVRRMVNWLKVTLRPAR